MCRIGLIVEYSRMQFPSLSRGCEIAFLFATWEPHPHLLDNLPHWGEHFDNYFNVDLWLKRLSKCSPQWGDCPTKGD